MFSYPGAPSGIVIMQSSDVTPHLITFAHPFPYINAATTFGTYAPAPPGAAILATTTAPITQQLPPPPQPQSAAAALVDISQAMGYNQLTVKTTSMLNTNRSTITNKSNGFYNNSSPIRRTRSGHVSKSRVSKRNTESVNLTKICPSCSKLWRLCNCSNVKNRPAPKPYCKFVPPRMLKQQNQK